MKHIWTVVCKKSIIDNDTNMISLLDVFEGLDVNVTIKKDEKDKQINIAIEYEVISFWIKEKDESIKKFFINVELIDPNSKILQIYKQEVDFPLDKEKIRTRLKIMGILLNDSGYYYLKSSYSLEKEGKYKEVASIPLKININKKQIPVAQAVS